MRQEKAVDKASLSNRDEVKFWRAQRFEEMECLSAKFVDHRYPSHIHDTYSIGVIIQGAEKFNCQGSTYIAPQGSIAALDPDIAHDGYPESDGFVYRMMYPSMELMANIHRDLTGKEALPHFKDIVYQDTALAQRLMGLHTVLEGSKDSLEQDSAFALVLSDLIHRHTDRVNDFKQVGLEHGPIAQIRQYLDDMYAKDITLDELANLVGLNRHYMIRAFKKHTGLTPHAYQNMRRAQSAKQQLSRGNLAIDVAMDCGFCDQSHLNRVFKKHFGLTPVQYRNQFGH